MDKTFRMDDKLAHVILRVQHLEEKEMAEITKFSDNIIHRIFHGHFGKHKVSGRRLPKSFLKFCGADLNPALVIIVNSLESASQQEGNGYDLLGLSRNTSD